MAEVFKNLTGSKQKVTQAVALHKDVQAKLDEVVTKAAYEAEGELVKHRAQGHAFIEVEEGDVDRYLILNDERGLKAALSIEYGRKQMDLNPRTGKPQSASRGLFILHRVLGIPIRASGGNTNGGDEFE